MRILHSFLHNIYEMIMMIIVVVMGLLVGSPGILQGTCMGLSKCCLSIPVLLLTLQLSQHALLQSIEQVLLVL